MLTNFTLTLLTGLFFRHNTNICFNLKKKKNEMLCRIYRNNKMLCRINRKNEMLCRIYSKNEMLCRIYRKNGMLCRSYRKNDMLCKYKYPLFLLVLVTVATTALSVYTHFNPTHFDFFKLHGYSYICGWLGVTSLCLASLFSFLSRKNKYQVSLSSKPRVNNQVTTTANTAL